MSTKLLLVMLIVLLISACSPSPTANPADRFAGTWVGNMTFTDYEGHNEDVVIMIPRGCAPGGVCGDLTSKAIHCTWEMTLESLEGDVFQYKITNVRPKGCPLLGEGSLTLQSDGALMAEHTTPLFVATGGFTRE